MTEIEPDWYEGYEPSSSSSVLIILSGYSTMDTNTKNSGDEADGYLDQVNCSITIK